MFFHHLHLPFFAFVGLFFAASLSQAKLCEALLRKQREPGETLHLKLERVEQIPLAEEDVVSIADLRTLFQGEMYAATVGSRALTYLRRNSHDLTAKEKAKAWQEMVSAMRRRQVTFSSFEFVEESGNRFVFIGGTGVVLIIDSDGAAYLTQTNVTQVHRLWNPTFLYSELTPVELNKIQ